MIGTVLIGVGLWLIYHPLAWLWMGLAAFAVSYLEEHRQRSAARRESDRRHAGPPSGTAR